MAPEFRAVVKRRGRSAAGDVRIDDVASVISRSIRAARCTVHSLLDRTSPRRATCPCRPAVNNVTTAAPRVPVVTLITLTRRLATGVTVQSRVGRHAGFVDAAQKHSMSSPTFIVPLHSPRQQTRLGLDTADCIIRLISYVAFRRCVPLCRKSAEPKPIFSRSGWSL